ncbi:unnamed protein product [Bursaphelenchus xylophilus]|uniref:DNA polymerase alpha subunit B n=1 Tax=Bursaphelenchus xylophilus TaxID=6326 RepID=A0A1I7RYJ3_BURXY|nr:unnamed protein product [Bursaphelenchus xylophilus]CAG9092624.1 unnamed protein product [Bursaphelenchus xylophilus]
MAAVNLVFSKYNEKFFSYGYTNENSGPVNVLDYLLNSQPIVAEEDEKEVPLVEVELEGRLVIKEKSNGGEELQLVGGGGFVQLELGNVNGFSYFSGMKVRVRCVQTSPGAHSAQILSVCPFPSLPLAQLNGDFDFLRVFMGFGPLLNGDSYEHFDYFLSKAACSSASALILSGPFYNPAEPNKAVEQTRITFAKIVEKFKGQKTKVLILPNANNDVLSTNTFPTPAQKPRLLGLDALPENIQFLPDPAIFTLNGISFVATTTDPLKHLAKLERYCGELASGSDRMSILCEHLLQQQSACPVTFGPESDVMVNIQGNHFSQRPHFFIVPSNLAPLKRNVQNTVFVNPGRFLFGQKVRYTKLDVNIKRGRTNHADSVGFSDFSSVDNRNEPIVEQKPTQ